MIKYASNAFLATKISFINEIANICEKVGANIEEVSKAMGMDKRIGSHFLKAGIGYGGSCFPKDTHALVNISGSVEHEFDLLKAVIRVNNEQRKLLVHKARERFGSLKGKRIALVGLSFKPGTDDMREAASIVISELLIKEGAIVRAYDPVALDNARKLLPQEVIYADSIDEAVRGANAVFILTEWDDIVNFNLSKFGELMLEPLIFDGRNCLPIEELKKHNIEYYSIGRPPIIS
jgi:UDPglucose 6-dehydrogenase